MKILINSILVFVSIAISLVCAEVGFRVFAYMHDIETLADMNQTIIPPGLGEQVPFHRMIQVSRNPRIIYELLPNVIVTYRGAFTSINANGFRGAMVAHEKNPGTTRVVGLGDSIMFGWGVRDNEGYMAVLDKLLRERQVPCPWEIVNTAVPGYNTVMEVETLRAKGIAYKPNLVIINYVGNDYDLPNFIRAQEDFYSLEESFMVNYFKGAIPDVRMVHAPVSDDGRAFESRPHKVPPQYRDMVGQDAYRKAMEDLQQLSRRHGFDVLVFSEKLLPDFVQEVSKRLGFGMLEVLPAWKAYAAEHSLDTEKDWSLNSNDPHPSAIGHRVIASALSDYIRGNYPTCY